MALNDWDSIGGLIITIHFLIFHWNNETQGETAKKKQCFKKENTHVPVDKTQYYLLFMKQSWCSEQPE